MNIFYLHHNTKKCAQWHCDKHVVKMILESAQMLSTAHRVVDESDDDTLYQTTHVKHPSTQWVMKSTGNYKWLFCLFANLCSEYRHRYRKVHLTETKLLDRLRECPRRMKDYGFVPPPQAMPDDVKHSDTITAYRHYYRKHKAHIHQYTKREVPSFLR